MWGSNRGRCSSGLVLVAVLCVELGWAAPADDAASMRARDLAAQAFAHVKQQRWAEALDLYRRAYSIVPAPSLAVREARCLVELGRFVEAGAAYRRAAQFQPGPDAPEPFVRAQADAKRELEALLPRIPRLKIVIEPSSPDGDPPQAQLDDGALTPAMLDVFLPIDPGVHTLKVTTADGRQQTRTVELAEGARRELVLHLGERSVVADPPATSYPVQATIGWVALGLGAVALVVGIGAGVDATSTEYDLEQICLDRACPPSAEGQLDSFRTMRTVSTVGYVTSAVFAVTGVTLLLTVPDEDAKASPRVSLQLAGPSIGLLGRF